MASSLAESLKSKIEHEILMFNFKPGERLDECRLADRFGSSRTPVREALRLLAAEGFVRIRPHRGAVVSGLSIPELNELFEMMAISEGICARLAAARATPEELADITEAHEECRARCKAEDLKGYCLANARFHEAIYRASHNGHLIKQTISIRNRLGSYRRFQLRRHNRLHDSFSEHEAIFNAIRAGQSLEADRLMQKHIAVQAANITQVIANLPADYFAETSRGQQQLFLARDSNQAYPAVALAFE